MTNKRRKRWPGYANHVRLESISEAEEGIGDLKIIKELIKAHKQHIRKVEKFIKERNTMGALLSLAKLETVEANTLHKLSEIELHLYKIATDLENVPAPDNTSDEDEDVQ